MNLQSETADRMLEKAVLNYPGTKVNTAGTLLVWLEAFDRVDDAIMKEALKLTIKRCKFFPTVADMQESIDTIRQQRRTYNDIPALDRAKNYDSPTAKRLFTLMQLGKFKQFADAIELEPEIVSYARAKFPMISERLIRENILEIMQAKEGSEKCFGCMWKIGDCDTNGYFPVMELQSHGQIYVSMIACHKNTANG